MQERRIPNEQTEKPGPFLSLDRDQGMTDELRKLELTHYREDKPQEREAIGVRLLEYLDRQFDRCATGDQEIAAAACFILKHEYRVDRYFSFDAVIDKLEQRGHRFDLEQLESMLQNGSYYVQFFACQLARNLSPEEMDEFLSFVDVQYDATTKKGISHLRTESYGSRYRDFDVSNYHEPLLRILGDSIIRHVHGNGNEYQEKYELKYLHILQRHICNTFRELPQRMNVAQPEDFLNELSVRRVEKPAEYNPHWTKNLMALEEESMYAEAIRIEPFEGVKRAIKMLKEFGGEKTLAFAKAWIHFHPEGNNWQIADTLSAIDPNKAAYEFLPLLKSSDRAVAKAASTVLERLEFGRIGITEEGVQYLQKTFDLGRYNNPSYHVQRLTSHGEVGIFNENQKLINFFRLGGLDSEEAVIRAQVLEFTYHTLFTPRQNETPEQRAEREQHLEEFQRNYFGFYNDNFFKETGVQFNNLSFKEQGQLLLFYKSASEDEKKRALEFVRKYKEDGFRAFLSLEHGRDMGDAILTIGESLPQEAAERIFEKYAEIVLATEDVRQYVQEQFGTQLAQDPAVIGQVVENLLKRGKDFLVRFADSAETAKKEQRRIAVEEILGELACVKADILLFASVFKVATDTGESLAIEELCDTTLMTHSAGTFSSSEKKEMLRIHSENRQQYPPEVLKGSVHEFQKVIEGEEGGAFSVVKYKDEIIAYLHMKHELDGSVSWGWMNVRPEVRGSSLGSALLHTTIDAFAKQHYLRAMVVGDNPMLKHYVEDFQHMLTHIDLHSRVQGRIAFTMERDDRNASQYIGPTKTAEDIIEEATQRESSDGYRILHYDLRTQKNVMGEQLEHLLNQEGYAVTRYLQPKREEPIVYLVLEKLVPATVASTEAKVPGVALM